VPYELAQGRRIEQMHTRNEVTEQDPMQRLRRFLPRLLFLLLPLTLILPNFLRLGHHRLNYYELLLPMVFLAGWSRSGSRFSGLLIGLAAASVVAVLHGQAVFGVNPSLDSFALVRYLVSYIAALQIGLRLPFKELDRKSPLAMLSFLMLGTIVLLAAISDTMRNAIAATYGFLEHSHPRFQLIDPNPLVLGSVAIILYFFASRGRSFAVRLLLFLGAFATVILAQQRTSLILLLLFFILDEFVLLRRRVGAPMIASLAAAVLLILALTQYGANASRVGSFSFERQSRAMIGRVALYAYQLQQVADFPAFGVGRFPDATWEPIASWYPAPRIEPHSQYVGIIYETGALGTLVFGLFLWYILSIGRRLYRDRRYSGGARAALAFGLLYFVSMAPWETLYLPHWTVILCLLIGASVAHTRQQGRELPARTPLTATVR
jgi:O-antigen ligase